MIERERGQREVAQRESRLIKILHDSQWPGNFAVIPIVDVRRSPAAGSGVTERQQGNGD